MVIWNYKNPVGVPPDPNPDTDTAQYLPVALKPKLSLGEGPLVNDNSPGGVKVVYIKELHRIIGKEVVLMRPAVANGALVSLPFALPLPTPPNSPLVQVLAPVDSFDCTGIAHQTYTK